MGNLFLPHYYVEFASQSHGICLFLLSTFHHCYNHLSIMLFDDLQIWPLLAGLGLFLFGMFMLEEALKALAGRSFKRFLRRHTTHPIKAVLSGALVTALLQSSSMVSLLVMSFAGAGIIGLKNGIGMIMGANLGTTMTGWLVSLVGFKLNLGAFVLPFLAVGGLGTIFFKSERLSQFSKLLMGFSFMFLGLDYMKNGFADFAGQADLSFLAGQHWLLFFVSGALLSASIQSSSAAMMIFLSSLAAGIITLEQGFYLVIGSDLGTTITAIIGTAQGNAIRRKVGWSQFFFNVITAVLALLLLPVLTFVLLRWLRIADPLIALVAFQSLFNLVGILVLLPFLGLFTRLIDRYIAHKGEHHAGHLALANPDESFAATEALAEEAHAFLIRAVSVGRRLFNLPSTIAEPPNTAYFDLKAYENEVAAFYLKLQQNPLSAEEVARINSIVAALRNATLAAKAIKDVRHDLERLSNAVDDRFFAFYGQMCGHQAKFYDELDALMPHIGAVSESDVAALDALQATFHQDESVTLYAFYQEKAAAEVDMASMMNLLRTVSHSNEALLRSLRHLVALQAGAQK